MRSVLRTLLSTLAGLAVLLVPSRGPIEVVPRDERLVSSRLVAPEGRALRLAVPAFTAAGAAGGGARPHGTGAAGAHVSTAGAHVSTAASDTAPRATPSVAPGEERVQPPDARPGAVPGATTPVAVPAGTRGGRPDGSSTESPAEARTERPARSSAEPLAGTPVEPAAADSAAAAALVREVLLADLAFEGVFELVPTGGTGAAVDEPDSRVAGRPAGEPVPQGRAATGAPRDGESDAPPGSEAAAVSASGAAGGPATPAVERAATKSTSEQAVGDAAAPPVPGGVPSPGADSTDHWRSLGADGVLFGSVAVDGTTLSVEVRLVSVASGDLVWGRGYVGPAADPRQVAHVIAHEILAAQADVTSVALSRLAFVSDRGGTRRELGGLVRRFKEVWVADYDGTRQKPVTFDRDLNMSPSWSPDGRHLAFTSFRRGFQDVFVVALGGRENARVPGLADAGAAAAGAGGGPGDAGASGSSRTDAHEAQGRASGTIVAPPEGAGARADLVGRLLARPAVSPTRGVGKSWLPAWSPDGTRFAITSDRDGNAEIYLVGRDGSHPVRLTRHPAIDTSPAWSPRGDRIAFTSDRTGRPQIWVMNADGSGQRALTDERYCDRPAWSPGPADEIAYVSRTKTGFDIKVKEVATGAERQLTFGEGFNESPAWSPTGRHLAFTSTRRGGQQIWTMTRDGRAVRQVTSVGNNTMPAWSPLPAPAR